MRYSTVTRMRQVFLDAAIDHEPLGDGHQRHARDRGDEQRVVDVGPCRDLAPQRRAARGRAHQRHLVDGHAAGAHPVGQGHLGGDRERIGNGQPRRAGNEHAWHGDIDVRRESDDDRCGGLQSRAAEDQRLQLHEAPHHLHLQRAGDRTRTHRGEQHGEGARRAAG
jgi:hypothetical protein